MKPDCRRTGELPPPGHTPHPAGALTAVTAKACLRRVLAAIALVLPVTACASDDPEPIDSLSTSTVHESSSVSPTDGLDGPTPVIVDYSPTVSDVAGLMYLLAHPDVEVIAVTLPATGEAGCDLGVDVTLRILEMFRSVEVPVACDPDIPEDAGRWPAEFLAGSGGLLSGLPETSATASEERAGDLIAQAVSSADRPVVIYAVAPLTNVAQVVTEHPDVIGDIEQIVIMGGAFDVPGNVESTSAEWNVWIDVAAADEVIESGAPVTLVPLDATNDVPIPLRYGEALDGPVQSVAIDYLSGLVETFPAVTSGFFFMWDELAAAVAAGQEVVTIEETAISINQDQGPGYGGTFRDPNGDVVRVATGVIDPESFYSDFLTILAGAPIEMPSERRDRPTLVMSEESVPQRLTSTSTPGEVLAFWLIHGVRGDVDLAGPVVSPGAPWVGFATSADAFVEGSSPYNSFDIEVECNSDANVASCEMTWSDDWIEAIPDLEVGGLRVQAEVIDGVIVAFNRFEFSSDLAAAFDGHLTWLRAEHPDRFKASCAADASSRGCSDLIVATVHEWVEGR